MPTRNITIITMFCWKIYAELWTNSQTTLQFKVWTLIPGKSYQEFSDYQEILKQILRNCFQL